MKLLEEEPYTIEESRRAAGMGVDKGAFTARREEAEKEKKGEMAVEKTVAA